MSRHHGNIRPTRRINRAGLAALVAVGPLATGGLAALAETVSASAPLSVGRIAGANRYATAVDIAKAAFGGGSGATPNLPTVIMATGTNFPDALTASYLAGQMRTAILLTDPNSLSASTRAGLVSFGTRAVDLIGGSAAVSNSVVADLTGMGIRVTRIFDQDGCSTSCSRFDTMKSVDTMAGMTPGSSTAPDSQAGLSAVSEQRTAILATGNNFPDALAAGPLAVADHFPIILTAGSASTLVRQAAAVIKADGITHLVVVGGSAAINPAQYSHLPGVTVDTSATEGSNRSQTSELLALDGVAHYGLSNTVLNIANGYDPSVGGSEASSARTRGVGGSSGLVGFTPDALAGAVLGGTGAPLAPTLITNSPTDPGYAVNFVKAEAGTLVQGDVFGGTAAVTPSAMTQILAAVPGATGETAAAGSVSATVSDPAAVSGPTAVEPSGPPGAGAASAVQAALAQQGVPYVYGGSSPAGFDCSGLVMYAWAAAGVTLPHNSVAQYDATTHIPFADIAPGDIVFYDGGGGPNPGHVALYIGGGQVVVADTTGTVVRVQSLYVDGTPMGYGQVG
jgi:cell wall-associated NlpC family hydrolase/putative cell wall-binding protein